MTRTLWLALLCFFSLPVLADEDVADLFVLSGVHRASNWRAGQIVVRFKSAAYRDHTHHPRDPMKPLHPAVKTAVIKLNPGYDNTRCPEVALRAAGTDGTMEIVVDEEHYQLDQKLFQQGINLELAQKDIRSCAFQARP